MKTKNLIAEKISSLIYAASILIFIIAFNFSDNPPSGWTQQFLPDLNNRPLSDIQFIDSLTGYGVTGDDTIGDTNYIIKTTNSGDNWFIINIIDKDLTDVDFININTGYVIGGLGTPGYLIKTTNGGENWIEIITPVASGFDDMFVYNEDTIWIASDNTFNGGLFKTTNGGVNWVLQYFSGANPPRNIYMVNSQLGFFSTNNQSSLFKTTNGGMNWILMANQNGFKDIYFTDSLTGWKSTGGIKKTTDGGLNWIEQVLPPKGGIISTSSIIKFSNINSDTIWGAGGQAFYGSGRRRGIIYRTTNGGNNWMIQIPDTSFHIEGFYSIQFLNKYTGWSFGARPTNFFTNIHTISGGDSSFFTIINLLGNEIITNFQLNQNFPNPFNPVTTIKYDLKVTSFIKLKIYDITGKYIKELVNQKQQSGNYEVKFDGSDLSSGVYFYKLTLETVSGGKEFSETKRMILLK